MRWGEICSCAKLPSEKNIGESRKILFPNATALFMLAPDRLLVRQGNSNDPNTWSRKSPSGAPAHKFGEHSSCCWSFGIEVPLKWCSCFAMMIDEGHYLLNCGESGRKLPRAVGNGSRPKKCLRLVGSAHTSWGAMCHDTRVFSCPGPGGFGGMR